MAVFLMERTAHSLKCPLTHPDYSSEMNDNNKYGDKDNFNVNQNFNSGNELNSSGDNYEKNAINE